MKTIIFIATMMLAMPVFCQQETSEPAISFSIEFKQGRGFIAFDKTGKELFQVYTFDNGPDYVSDGLLRMVKDGKIGYADTQGKIIISPRFDCALPFDNGVARVSNECKIIKDGEHTRWESDKWVTIDKTGSVK